MLELTRYNWIRVERASPPPSWAKACTACAWCRPASGRSDCWLRTFYCSASRASLPCSGTCWAQHRSHTVRSQARRQALNKGLLGSLWSTCIYSYPYIFLHFDRADGIYWFHIGLLRIPKDKCIFPDRNTFLHWNRLLYSLLCHSWCRRSQGGRCRGQGWCRALHSCSEEHKALSHSVAHRIHLDIHIRVSHCKILHFCILLDTPLADRF